jgi:hypothetical protein
MKNGKVVFVSSSFLFLLILIFIGTQWRNMQRRNVDIDLNSGICRERYYFWFIPIKTNSLETEYSILVQPYVIRKEPDWYNDVEVGGLFSYCTSGGDLTAACHDFAVFIKINNYDEEKKEILVRKSLEYLKEKNETSIKDLLNQHDSVSE